jgi:hypothetical protein
MTIRRHAFAVLCAVLIGAGSATMALSAQSADAAGDLVSLMTQRKLDAFAVQHPQAANLFLAALLIPDCQLLVVSAEYPAPAELAVRISQGTYRDVYAALHQPVSAPTRFFVVDPGCDGLRGKGGAADVLYERGVTQTLLNGNWRAQALSEDAYRVKEAEAESRYTTVLRQLVEALKSRPEPDH